MRVVGHMVHFAMVERGALSVLDEVWRFADRCGQAFRGLVPILSRTALPWSVTYRVHGRLETDERRSSWLWMC